MRMDAVCDTYLPYIITLRDELKIVWNKVNEKYEKVNNPKVIGFAFRCLPDKIGRKSFRRYDRNQELTLDITISYDKCIKMYKTEIRHFLGHTFYTYLKESLNKYNFKDLNTIELLNNIKLWCNEIGWLEDEVDYSKDLEYPP